MPFERKSERSAKHCKAWEALVADPNERLKVQFEVDLDRLKGQLDKAGIEFDGMGKRVTGSTNQATEGFRKVDKQVTLLQRRVEAFGKVAFGAFTIGLVSKVLGFGSAMDLVDKATDAAAQGIRELGKSLIGINEQLIKPAENLESLGEKIKSLRDQLNARRVSVFGEGGNEFFFEIPDTKDVQQQLAAFAAVAKAQKDIQNILTGLAPGSKSNFALFGNAQAFQRGFQFQESETRTVSDVLGELQTSLRDMAKSYADLQKQQEATKREQDRVNESFERGAEAARRARASAAVGQFAAPFGVAAAQFGAAAARIADRRDFVQRSNEIKAERSANEALERFFGNAVRLAEFTASVGMRAFEQLDAISRTRSAGGSPSFLIEGIKAATEKLGEFTLKVRDAALESTTFGAKAERAFNSLKDGFRESLPQQQVDTSFQAFRGFFRDIISGAADAGDAFRNLAANVVVGIADMIAQWLALKATGFLFGFAGGPGGLAAFAGAGGGGGAPSPLNAPTGQLGASRSILGGGAPGGAGLTINLTVQALDPRTAGDVVMAQMPLIQQALVGVIAGGGDRRLYEQIRSIR